jgi:serine protease Do
MNNGRAFGFLSLLAVVGVSIVFGMVIGGKVNSPPVGLAAPASTPPVQLVPATTGPGMTNFADVVETVMPAIVSVTSRHVREEDDTSRQQRQEFFHWFFGPDADPDNRDPGRPQPRYGEGSGFIISADGYVLTNNHVVEDADQIRIGLQSGVEVEARVVGTDPSIDLALLKIDEGDEEFPVLPMGDSDALRVGEWVVAIGNPLDYEHTVTVGVISAKERRVQIGGTDSGVASFIQTDAAINFGNSGGPLIDTRGNVIGINTAIRRANYAEGIGFALPINHARRVIEQLRETGSVKRGYVGITMNREGIDEAAREYLGLPDTNGVIIDDVTDDGPAARAGLRKDDVIRKVNGDPVRDNLDLIGKIASHRPGDSVKLEVYRKGETLQLEATLADRDEGLRAQFGSGRPQDQPEEATPTESEGLGITVENISRRIREDLGLDESQRGVVITEVDFDSAAWRKQLRPGMIVTGISGETVRDVSDWVALIDSLKSGDSIKLSVIDSGTPRSVFLRVPETE